jgi:hypothetical protein
VSGRRDSQAGGDPQLAAILRELKAQTILLHEIREEQEALRRFLQGWRRDWWNHDREPGQ